MNKAEQLAEVLKELLVKKIDGASKGFGRGSDNVRVPPRYGIFNNGKLVGRILGGDTRQFAKTEWKANKLDARFTVVARSQKGFKIIKAYIESLSLTEFLSMDIEKLL
tara:strand:- start:147 stop:470 length:324 start_codon:yes stop_codon:yes gene_type:complete